MRRNKNTPLIAILGVSLILFLIVNAIRNIRIYIVYSSGIGPWIIVVLILLIVIFLYVKGL